MPHVAHCLAMAQRVQPLGHRPPALDGYAPEAHGRDQWTVARIVLHAAIRRVTRAR